MVPTVIVELVDQLKHRYSVKMMLEVLELPKSTYYRWKNKHNKNDNLTQKVIQLCKTINIPTVIEKLHPRLINRLQY